MRMRTGTVLAGLCISVALVTSCGGGSNASGTQGGAASTATQGSSDKAALQAWCALVRTEQAKAASLQDIASGPDEVRAGAERSAAEAVLEKAPQEMQVDMNVYVQTLDRLLTTWQQSNFSLDVIEDPARFMTGKELNAYQQSRKHLSSFVNRNC